MSVGSLVEAFGALLSLGALVSVGALVEALDALLSLGALVTFLLRSGLCGSLRFRRQLQAAIVKLQKAIQKTLK